jgi:hypothetical protein
MPALQEVAGADAAQPVKREIYELHHVVTGP